MRTVIIGNSGSGKSTLARQLAEGTHTPTLDLDTLVWEPGKIAVERDRQIVLKELAMYCDRQKDWIVEGCYADCVQTTLQFEPELIFLEPGLDACLSNCRNRPWEPHKYTSREEQDSKLQYLLRWVTDYYERDGNMSLKAHADLFDKYHGRKTLMRELPPIPANLQ
jgi:adenylate kinase family enzyme